MGPYGPFRAQRRRDPGRGSGELLDERVGSPLLVAVGRPGSIGDEEAVDLGRHECVHDVGGVAGFQSGAEFLFAVQCLHDLVLPAIALPAESSE